MLEGLRANKGGIITWIFLGAIILVFVISFGPGSFSKGGAGCGGAPAYAARVNGRTIPAVEWERQYGQLFNLYQAQMGNAFTRELAAQLGLADQALSQVVDRELVVQEAKRRGLAVSDGELVQAVQSLPAFQQNGVFDAEQFRATTRQNFGSPAKFEAWYRDQLLHEKMLAAVAQTVKLSEAEVKEAWRADAEKIGLSFARFPLAAAGAQAKPTDAQVKAYAEKNAEAVKKVYDENPARFDQAKKARVRHVLARVGPGADEAAARKKIEDAKARVAKGEDFGKVAQALSEDANTKEKGGELGWVTEGLFDEAFAKAALALEPGGVSEPVRSASGWHLVKAEEVTAPKKVSFEEARLDIARELLAKEEARRSAQAKAEAALAAAKAGKKLPGAEETGTFSASTPFVPKLGQAPEIVKDALAAKPGDVLPKVYETPAGPVVAVVTQRESADPAQFEKQREELQTRLRNQKESQVVAAWLDVLRKEAEIERNAALLGGAPAEG
jgi:peptidyl-prolyl cis-trans isomerase D